MKSSAGRSRAGSGPARGPASARPRGAAGASGTATLLQGFDRGEFPPTLYLEGPSEPLKAALLAELRAAWMRSLGFGAGAPDAPARVMRAGEAGVEEILAAYHGGSLFSPRELTIVLGVDDLVRSEKKIAALAEGLSRPSDGSTLALVESAAEKERKSLEPLRAACAARWIALPPGPRELVAWGARRLARTGVTPEPGLLDALIDACEGEALAFFSELGKLEQLAAGRTATRADLALLLRPAVGADLPDYLAAVAAGDVGRAARSLGRLLAAGVSEGTILFALSNLVGGALGGWTMDQNKPLSPALRGRRSVPELTAAMDALYRAESAWKGGRADAVAVLEQATRVVAGGK